MMTFEEYYHKHYEFSDDEEFKKALELAWKAGHEVGYQESIQDGKDIAEGRWR